MVRKAQALLRTSGSWIFIQTCVLIIVGVNAKHSIMLPSADGSLRDLPFISELRESQQTTLAEALETILEMRGDLKAADSSRIKI
jgi:hypothetical protein